MLAHNSRLPGWHQVRPGDFFCGALHACNGTGPESLCRKSQSLREDHEGFFWWLCPPPASWRHLFRSFLACSGNHGTSRVPASKKRLKLQGFVPLDCPPCVKMLYSTNARKTIKGASMPSAAHKHCSTGRVLFVGSFSTL